MNDKTNVFAQFINGTIKTEMILSQKSNYVVKEEEEKNVGDAYCTLLHVIFVENK